MANVKDLLKKNWVKYGLVGVICFTFGGCSFSGSASEADTLKKSNEELKNKVATLETKANDLQKKVDEAAPFFALSDAQKEQEKIKAQKEQDKINKEKAEKEAKEKEKALEAKTKTLSNGKYEAGSDFEVGKYNIIAVKGGGNVMCSGSINAIMGVEDDGFHQKEYKNITFRKGQILDIRNVTIKLVPVN